MYNTVLLYLTPREMIISNGYGKYLSSVYIKRIQKVSYDIKKYQKYHNLYSYKNIKNLVKILIQQN